MAARLTHTTGTVASAVPGPAGLDLADWVNMALAAEYRTCSALTMDHRDGPGQDKPISRYGSRSYG